MEAEGPGGLEHLGTEQASMGPVLRDSRYVSTKGELAAQTGTCVMKSGRQGSVNPSTVTYQLWDHAFLSLVFHFYKLWILISTLQG